MQVFPILVALVIIGAGAAFIYAGFRLYYRRIAVLPQRKELAAPSANFRFIPFQDVENLLEHPELDSRISATFSEYQVKSIYLVHGTFVGEDPFHIAALLERSFPNLNPTLIEGIKQKIKQGQNLLAKDVGNFVDDHVTDFQSRFSSNIFNFSWSSANHHFARVEGCVNLIEHLAHNHSKQDRVLLIGHSHAGQIFAILTKLFFDTEFRNEVDLIFGKKNLLNNLIKIQHLKFDFVTLGTPARYKWELSENMRLLHIINHRGNDLLGGSFKDATFTYKGDYIQQWGIAGSDMKSTDSEMQKYNSLLDKYLGPGADLEVLRSKIQFKNRLHNQGFHLLVDFGDNSKLPNFFKTVFGHGVYTRFKFIPFILHVIKENFYSETLTRPN